MLRRYGGNQWASLGFTEVFCWIEMGCRWRLRQCGAWLCSPRTPGRIEADGQGKGEPASPATSGNHWVFAGILNGDGSHDSEIRATLDGALRERGEQWNRRIGETKLSAEVDSKRRSTRRRTTAPRGGARLRVK